MITKYPFVTIILPIRNERQYITSALISIFNQNYPENKIELLIADGCSTDGTTEIIKNFQKNHLNIQLIENFGEIVSEGFNLALSQSIGEYILRIDGHSELPPNYLNFQNHLQIKYYTNQEKTPSPCHHLYKYLEQYGILSKPPH